MAARGIIPEPPIDELLPTKEPTALVKQRRLLNRWSIFALVFVSAIFTVLYVSNVIGVKKLLVETDALKRSIDSLRTVNESLRTESYRLQSAERITRIAQDKLGLIPPPKAPTVLEDTEQK
ncbi:MAG: cell division protein FtsL [Ignavibacteria bacterium]|nr:cell division protein FtsL [Ignavibacteria bacterium]MBP6510103.1 cell division protein FtsL [Candidatus Kapabacteria bacterium]MBK6419907.1 cell division protein FtsL [Ignavibacteria bacterium]MBK6759461.1 cell division protein FtsL [Ignavibacteria bacterium]MBK7033357.1 cell division protein FtsL [Ignavibacteria bacterium]